jgi:4-amino-4-deoxy-L-arabinose transferase-like glycosyltransferase
MRGARTAWGDGLSGRRACLVVAVAIALGIAARAAFAFGYWTDKPMTHDEIEYLDLGRNLADGRGFVYSSSLDPGTGQRFGRAPLYPVFLAVVLRATGTHAVPAGSPSAVTAIKAAQALLGGFVIALIALIAYQATGRQQAAVAAAAVAAAYPPLVWIGAYVLSEALFTVLALASVALLGSVVDAEPPAAAASPRRHHLRIIAAGALAGLAALTRPVMIFFLAFAAAWLLARRRWAWLAALSLGAALVVLPWTVRNVRETGRLVLIASEGGVTFWTGNNAMSPGEGDLAANPEMKRAEIALRAHYPGWTAEQLEPVYYRAAFAYILRHPFDWVWLVARKFFYVWVPIGPSYRLHSARYFAASVVSYALLLPLAIVGFRRLWTEGRRPRALWLLAASSVFACLVFFPQERFRIPVIDPACIVGAAAWVASGPSRRERRAGTPAATAQE